MKIMNKVKIMSIFVAAVAIAFAGCERNEIELDFVENPVLPVKVMIELGDEINDPYAIHNIELAKASLRSAGINVPAVQANRKYIRFLPADEYELDLLTQDSTLILFEFPLHYEIAVDGVYFHDPSLPPDALTWQYTVVPIDKELPNVKYELLYKVFIPDLDSDESISIRSSTGEACFYELLLRESYRLTGRNNQESDNSQISTRIFNRWHASGQITVWDNSLHRQMPLAGVTVRARTTTRVEEVVTDSDGRFHAGRFIYDVTYSIQWSRTHFSIRAGTISQAVHNGPRNRRPWYLNLDNQAKNQLQLFYATIHRAAVHYYYGDIRGLRRPPGFPTQMRIAAVNSRNQDSAGRFASVSRVFGIGNPIKIWNNNPLIHRNTYAATIHELAHASHWAMVGNINYNITSSHVKESWANGVTWELTRMVYSGYRGLGRDNLSSIYTHVVMDMIDTRADDGRNYGASYPHDRVHGYTIRQIEDALNGVVTWNQWRDNIRRRNNNATSIHLDALFDYWRNK